MEDLNLISSGLYHLTSDKLGTEPVINMRRMVMDMGSEFDAVEIASYKNFEEVIYSGSKGEGLRFSSSDQDWMHVRRGVRVKFSLSQCSSSDNGQTILLAENSQTKPGFVLLRLISNTSYTNFLSLSIQYGTRYYLSSSLWVSHGIASVFWPESSPHGPCRSGIIRMTEVDFAECVKSDTLPPASVQTLFKLYQAGHLSLKELENLYKHGCHFVAICSKNPTYEHLEWRVSFSSIEKAIIYSMNHVQFLCYGLLKIFLKEVLDADTDTKGILCSYFMKTILFWELIDKTMRWTPGQFLECFWKCFNVLINWVALEYCPNFFIPENNMFADKFTRSQHSMLLANLARLYHEGFNCLLRCSSLRSELTKIIHSPPSARILATELDHVSKSRLECNMISEIWSNYTQRSDLNVELELVEWLKLSSSRCDLKNPCLRICGNIWLKRLLLCLGCRQEKSRSMTLNKYEYKNCRNVLFAMRVCSIDVTSHLLYMATYLYRCGKYEKAMQVGKKAKHRLQTPSIMYLWKNSVVLYEALGGGTRSFFDMMRTVVVSPVVLGKETCVPELYIEHQAAGLIFNYVISIPPLVYANFLIYLCDGHCGSFQSATSVLKELSTLIHYDNGYHIRELDRAISFEILGICQEIGGDYSEAYHSYNLALQQDFCPFKTAAQTRVRNVRRLLRR